MEPSFPQPYQSQIPEFPEPASRGVPGVPGGGSAPYSPPPYTPHQAPPSSGFRLALSTESALPPPAQLGPPVAHDADGRSPIYLGSALLPNAVHPCKVGPHLSPPCRVPYGGAEREHHGRYDLLPFDPATMEWVPTSRGLIPPGRRPIEGGYEESGKLYHALADIRGMKVPGKTGEHLHACNVAFGGGEVVVHENYAILCWK
ncbi:hypothetical protein BKA93DRAFT_793193 [Sparassis latifolia]|uniref:Uncharacterized protein n=1 Tax=Sparassis crispa TaxID=139825 RepID=A0A401H0N4_9APHY|nr:hypothetical protein SCP_1202220 [Sparassis crispa]GBE87996.1 hypothetical protein SCP_1202220 [Sparassis crispa]